MRVYNQSDKPYEWTADGKHYVVGPHEIKDFPDWEASFGIKASQVLDEFGQDTGVFALVPVSSVKGTAKYEAEAKYPCGICGPSAGSFGKADLETHMMEHFTKPAAPQAPAQQEGRDRSRLSPVR